MISIVYQVKDIEGVQVFKYIVRSNDQVEPEKNLYFKVECIPGVIK